MVDGHQNMRLYKLYGRAVRDQLISSAIAVNWGGLGVALAKKAIAGQMGLDIDLSALGLPAEKALFSETAGRILVTVAPQNKKEFETHLSKLGHMHQIGFVAYTDKLSIKNVLSQKIEVLTEEYKKPLKNY